MASHHEREGLRLTFDSASEVYHRARPDYPEELINHLVRVTDVGQATTCSKSDAAAARRHPLSHGGDFESPA
jgi:hypothetical protein